MPRAISLVRLRRGQAICRLAQLARLLIRNGAGRGERGRISGRFAELTLRGCRLIIVTTGTGTGTCQRVSRVYV